MKKFRARIENPRRGTEKCKIFDDLSAAWNWCKRHGWRKDDLYTVKPCIVHKSGDYRATIVGLDKGPLLNQTLTSPESAKRWLLIRAQEYREPFLCQIKRV